MDQKKIEAIDTAYKLLMRTAEGMKSVSKAQAKDNPDGRRNTDIMTTKGIVAEYTNAADELLKVKGS